MCLSRNSGRSIFAEIEAGNGNRLLCLPVTDAEISFLMFFEFGARSDQPKLARPAQEKVIVRKLRAIPKVGVPAFSRSDEQHAVSGVLDDVTAVMKMKSKFLIRPRRPRKDNIHLVVATCAALLEIHALVLKKSEGSALLSRDGVNGQSPGELEGEDALRPAHRAQTHAGGG